MDSILGIFNFLESKYVYLLISKFLFFISNFFFVFCNKEINRFFMIVQDLMFYLITQFMVISLKFNSLVIKNIGVNLIKTLNINSFKNLDKGFTNYIFKLLC